jgi:hypothetical protein
MKCLGVSKPEPCRGGISCDGKVVEPEASSVAIAEEAGIVVDVEFSSGPLGIGTGGGIREELVAQSSLDDGDDT